MRTRCPNPDCRHIFDVPAERAGRNGPCPRCGQVITFRSLDILRSLARERERQARAGRQFDTNWAEGDGSPPKLFALLEDIRSLWNVGSIFRTTDGAGLGGLILSGITGCPPRREIAKTGLGAENSVPWRYAENALDALLALKATGTFLLALERTAQSVPICEFLAEAAPALPLCLVVGNEVSGVSPEALARCDRVCHLPMRGTKSSLNVAVAFGIAAYRLAEVLLPEKAGTPPGARGRVPSSGSARSGA